MRPEMRGLLLSTSMRGFHNFLALGVVLFSMIATRAQIAEGFVDVTTLAPGLRVEMRYLTEWNFLGKPVDGYRANRCYLARGAAEALAKVQRDVSAQGYALLVFDCYRPQRAVDEFGRWVADAKDLKMRDVYYMDEPKAHLIERGYIAAKSGHSRGGTVDLTLIREPGKGKKLSANFRETRADCRYPKALERTGQLDMGTYYDCFSVRSNTDHGDIPAPAKRNRQLLRDAMAKHGFENYSKEWWHFTLKPEDFPDRYFDFLVE